MSAPISRGIKLELQGGREVVSGLAKLGATGERTFDSISNSAANANNAMSKFGVQTGRTSRQINAQFANAGNQIQDIVVQLEQGTDILRVATQQLPQLAGAFGAGRRDSHNRTQPSRWLVRYQALLDQPRAPGAEVRPRG